MSANKLSPSEKAERKTLKAIFKKANGIFVHHGGLTFAFVPTCRNKAHVSWAICSENEIHNRKRGELVALSRWNCGEFLPIEYGYQDRCEDTPLTIQRCIELASLFAETIVA